MNGLHFLSSRAHGILDYVVGVLLMIVPDLLGFQDIGGAAVAVPRVMGGLILIQAILTRYDMGLVQILPFSFHVSMDYLVGIFLVASPILFGFADESAIAWLPHVLVGACMFFSTLFTDASPPYEEVEHTMPSVV